MSGTNELENKNVSEKRTLIIFRTHLLANCILSEYKKIKKSLKPNEDLVVFFDNHQKKINLNEKNETPVYDIDVLGEPMKLLISDEELFETYNLPSYSKDNENADFIETFWYNSDYPFYMIYRYFPDYDYYWQIEYDVYCNGSYDTFWDKYRNSQSDLIVAQYKVYDSGTEYDWREPMKWIYDGCETCACLFPVVRLSNNAVNFLYNRRLEHVEIFNKIKKNIKKNAGYHWIYCETFVSTELTLNNFVCEEIRNQFLRYKPCFDLNVSRIFENPDGLLYHPIKPNIEMNPCEVKDNRINILGYYEKGVVNAEKK